MKVEIDDRPVSNQNPKGTCAIRLMPETNKEMAQLERCLTVNVQFEKFRRWANPDQVYYGFYGYYGSSSGEPTVISSTVKTFPETEPRKPREWTLAVVKAGNQYVAAHPDYLNAKDVDIENVRVREVIE